jgi:hypothetical protein
VWLGYTDPGYFARRHGLTEAQVAPIGVIGQLVDRRGEVIRGIRAIRHRRLRDTSSRGRGISAGCSGRVLGENAPVDPPTRPEELAVTFYVAGFEEIAWGVALVAIIMVLHGLGMVWTLRAVHGLKTRLGPNRNLAWSLLVLVVAAWRSR